MEVCPVGAIFRDEKDAVIINPDKCIGCKMCMNACPLGNIGFNTERRQVHKCDLCGGDPKCAKFCPTGAISYEDPEEGIDRKRAIADHFKDVFGEEAKHDVWIYGTDYQSKSIERQYNKRTAEYEVRTGFRRCKRAGNEIFLRRGGSADRPAWTRQQTDIYDGPAYRNRGILQRPFES